MGILDRLPAIVNGALGSLVFRDGVLKVPGTATSDGQGGWTPGTPVSKACKVLVEDYSDARRLTSLIGAGGGAPIGISQGDRKIIVLADSVEDGVVPSTGHTITAEGRDWQIVSVARDPAAATYECQGR